MTFNCNDPCIVRLTEYGEALYQGYLDDYPCFNKLPDGSYEFQLWELCNIFGPYMYNGAEIPFVDNKITIKE